MHPILEEFCDKWVWPTMPGAPGAEFRLKLTREQCLKGWGILLERNLRDIEEELASNDEGWKRDHALRGYAAEGVQMSIKQMSAQLLSVDIGEQENYIELQRMRARQIWDECKHSKLHADVLLGKGWVKNERELMDIAQANVQPLPAYFGLSMMFPHIHPLARAAELLHRSQCLSRHHGLSEDGRRSAGAARTLEPARRGAYAFHGGEVPARHVLHDPRSAASCRGRARLSLAPDRRDPVKCRTSFLG